MKKLYTRFTKLVFRFDEDIEDSGVGKHPYHLNYESGVYRESDLVKIIRGAMPHFALTPEEYSRLKDQDDIDEMYRLAFSRISKAKKDKKGDYGELLLFLLLQSFYNTERLVTKVKLRSSVKDQIKGFDCAHFTVGDDGQPLLWLGEVKFYKSFSGALDDVVEEIVAHTKGEYLKNEFSILCPNVEFNGGVDIPDSVVDILDGTVTLDDVKIVIPALVTYETAVLKAHTSIDQSFKDSIKKQFEKKYELINSRDITIPPNVEVFFLLLPLSDVDSIKSKLEQIEAVYR
ncbi:HamA C-terminal domain-containing protein [Pseudomonas monteilii]|uniref:HamA C-terminal domain-containing protein n=1 Tax=Pseudomonas monteilii TaxID=76759 RepID=UPI003D9656A7